MKDATGIHPAALLSLRGSCGYGGSAPANLPSFALAVDAHVQVGVVFGLRRIGRLHVSDVIALLHI